MVDARVTRTALRRLLVAGALLVAAVFLPWQQRDVQIHAKEPIPATFPDRPELQGEITNLENGGFTVRGYDVHKATPFGDGVLVGAVGAVTVVACLVALTTRRHLRSALIAISGGALLALAVTSYDSFVYPGLWSPRDWWVSWGDDSLVRTETELELGMFVALAVAAYLAWCSITMLRTPGVLGPSNRGSVLPSSGIKAA